MEVATLPAARALAVPGLIQNKKDEENHEGHEKTRKRIGVMNSSFRVFRVFRGYSHRGGLR
jgi:hypothetical protein